MCYIRRWPSRWVNSSSSLSTSYDNNTCKHITFELNDKDVIDTNNFGLFSINDILNNKYVNYSYAYVYAQARVINSSDVATQMNINSELGSLYRDE